MARCADSDDIYKAAQGAFGIPVETFADFSAEDVLGRGAHVEQRNAAIDELTVAAAANGPTGETLTPGDNRAVKTTAKWVSDLIDQVDTFRQNRAALYDEGKNIVHGTTVGTVSRWLNFTNSVREKFLDDRAAFSKWAYAFMRDDRFAPYAQPIVQKLDSMIPRIKAQKTAFHERQQALLDKVTPVARANGQNRDWLMNMMGFYAVAKHIPEANADLIAGWKTSIHELNELLASGVEPEHVNRIVRMRDSYEAKLNLLEPNLESTDKVPGMYSAGFTNRQARDLQEHILQKTGISRELADEIAGDISREFQHVVEARAQNGLIHENQLKAFPNFQHYVALMGVNENLLGPINDSVRYDPGSYHAREGMRDTPASAWASLQAFSDRAATEIGMQDFALTLYAAKVSKGKEKLNIGLRDVKYDTLMRWKMRGTPNQQALATRIMDSGGIVVDVPTRRSGGVEFERKYMYFDPNWSGHGVLSQDLRYKTDARGKPMLPESGRTGLEDLDGVTLNRALFSSAKIGKALEWGGKATSLHGQMYTHLSLGFAPVSGARDGMERLMHMTNRAYYSDAGAKLGNRGLMMDFITNIPRATGILFDALRNKEGTMQTRAQTLWQEFKDTGSYQKMTPGRYDDFKGLDAVIEKKPKTLEELTRRKEAAFLDKTVQSVGSYGRKLWNALDTWNDFWQNIPAFAQFIALRENGVNPRRASSYVLDVMNMSQKGTLTPYLRILSPFVVPTMQSAAAMSRTLGLSAATPKSIIKEGAKGWLGVLGGFAAFSALGAFERESMGYDEDGNSRWDAMKVRDLAGFLPIGLGDDDGTYAKLPIGFGPVRLARVASIAADRVQRGLMTPSEMAAEVIFAAAKDVAPMTSPQFDFSQKPGAFIMQILTPDVVKPLIETAANTNYFGSSIANEPRQGTARADQGRLSTDPFWHQVARYFSRQGIVDAPPEHYAHLAKSYFAGPLRLLGEVFRMIEGRQDSPTSSSYDPDGLDGIMPWLRAIGGTYYVGRQQDINRGMYYDYQRQMETKIQRAGVKLTNSKLSGKPEEARAYRQQALSEAGFSDDEIADYEIMRVAGKQLMDLNAAFNERYRETWINMEDVEQVREAFRERDEVAKAIYAEVVRNLSYYRNRQ